MGQLDLAADFRPSSFQNTSLPREAMNDKLERRDEVASGEQAWLTEFTDECKKFIPLVLEKMT